VLYADTIYNNFLEAMTTENWNSEMPSNVLLISGPSKTADIEQTLVYGVHGCKELVVLLIQ
jgi:L-lactate dehydrogenase complex protein LldG